MALGMCFSPHRESFSVQIQKWCKKNSYNFSVPKAQDIYKHAKSCAGGMPQTETIRILVSQAAVQLRAITGVSIALQNEMNNLANHLSEYPVVRGMFVYGPTLGPQLMA